MRYRIGPIAPFMRIDTDTGAPSTPRWVNVLVAFGLALVCLALIVGVDFN